MTIVSGGLIEDSGGDAVEFTGLADSNGAFCPDSPINSSNNEDRSISVWFNADNVTSRQIVWENGGTGNGYQILVESNQVHCNAWEANGADYNQASVSIVTGVTYHVALVLSGTDDDIKCYVDGAEMASQTLSNGQISNGGNDNCIGCETVALGSPT